MPTGTHSSLVTANNVDLIAKYRIKGYATVSRNAVIDNMRKARCVEDSVVWAIILESWCGPQVREGCYVKDKDGYVAPDRKGNPTPHDETSLLKVLNWPESKKPQVYRAIRSLKAQNRLTEEDGVWYLTVNPAPQESVTDPETDKHQTLILGIRVPAYIYEGPEESVTDRVSRMEKVREKYVTDLKSLLQQARSDLKQIISEPASLFTEKLEEIEVGRSVEETAPPVEEERLTDRQTEILQAIPPDLLNELKDVPTPELLARIDRNLKGAEPAALTHRIEQRRRMIQSLGAIECLADDVGKAWVRAEKARDAAVEAEKRRKEAAAQTYEVQEVLDDPVVSKKPCPKCPGQVIEYQSGYIEWCKCGPEGRQ